MNRMWILALAVAAVVVAVMVTGNPAAEPGASSVVATSSASADLVAARRAAGIEDCPTSSDAEPVPGGLPDITLECLGGDSSVRLAGLRGPMLINLWAQWCEPCRAEAADLVEFAKSQHTVAVLGINYSDPQPALAIEFAQLMTMTYPQLADLESVTRGPLQVAGIPHTVLIDADGVIVARHPGVFTSTAEIRAWVEQGLGK